MTATTADQNKETVREFFGRVWGDNDLSFVDDHFADDFVAHETLQPKAIQGPAEFKTWLETLQTAFPDVEVGDLDIIAEGDTVAVRYTWTGTHEGELIGIDPTGTTVEGAGIAFHRFEDGKWTESWINDDTFGLLQQLGVVEPPGE